MEEAEDEIEVRVICALPHRQLEKVLRLPEGATAGSAIDCCELQAEFPEVDFASAPVGIYGQVVTRTTVLRHGDRVEIYRGLLADPKEARRRRVGGGR